MANTVERIAVASDKSGFPLKKAIYESLQTDDRYELIDFGLASENENEPYDAQAPKVARAIQQGTADRGILICGTGQGMAIVANKHKGVYAVVGNDIYAGEKGRMINNCNVITLGGWIVAPQLGLAIVRAWLALSFTETMPDRAEWLRSAFARVQSLEDNNFS